MIMAEGMAEVIKDNYMYRDILELIKFNYGIAQADRYCLKEHTKAINIKEVLKQCKNYPCLVNRVKIGSVIFMV